MSGAATAEDRPVPRPERTSRAAVVAARLVAVLAAVAAAAAVALPLATGGGWAADLFRTPEPVVAPSFAAAAAVLVGMPAARRLAWLLLVVAASAGAYVLASSIAAAGPSSLADWARSWTWIPGLLVTTAVLPHVVPYGRPLPGVWRAVAAAAAAFTVLSTAVTAVAAAAGIRFQPFSTPLFTVPLLVLVLAGVVSVVVRVRRGGPGERRQLAWVGYGLVIAVVATFTAPPWAVAIAVLAVPLGLAVAATRYRLYDIDLVVDRTLVGLALLAGSALVYAAVTGWAGALFGASSPVAGFVAAFSVALVFHPLHLAVRRAVARLFRGRRPDPAELRQRVSRAVADAGSPSEALSAGAAEVARALALPAVAVEVPLPDGGTATVSAGRTPDAADGAIELPLRLHGEAVARLRVLPPRGRDVLPPPDRRALEEMAEALTAPAYAVRLASALDASRTELLTAREDERRRLRRDLHDGLGPQLAAAVMTLDTAASALGRGDIERADRLVTAGRNDVGEAVRDVRQLVEGLRPPSLDDLGLVETLRAGAAALGGRERDPDERRPQITVEAGALPPLPAATEVAALRIAQEAILNAVRHAEASRIRVVLHAAPDGLELDVLDDGRGIPSDAGREVRSGGGGVGLGSMRERAAELGGSLSVTALDPAGTRVHALLPLEESR
ncbi:ATP-binding protein [Naasia sp. SYSU D00948]|uniref:ATP-binding protein n=1 Tax=Naasia sp. SYSU D00948 TaxID=2817379 RepID=UPI001B30A157|nr:ATP-binding protein [Naasia sp. SYSU D00948]